MGRLTNSHFIDQKIRNTEETGTAQILEKVLQQK
jgi:hypothetical protein